MRPEKIGKKYGISKNVIYNQLRKFKIKREPFYMNKQWLYNQYIELELSTGEIGKICEVNHMTIRNWLKIHKIPMRSRSEAQKIAQNKPEVKKKISEKMKHVWTDSDFRESHSGEKHTFYGRRGKETSNWRKWNELGYDGKHRRKRSELKEMGIFEPNYCPICDKKPRIKKYMHLINLDHNYLDNTLDWYYICKWCHDLYDFSTGLRKKSKIIKKSPNLIEDLLKLKTREKRFRLLKEVISKCQ